MQPITVDELTMIRLALRMAMANLDAKLAATMPPPPKEPAK